MDHLINQSNKLYLEVKDQLNYSDSLHYNYIVFFKKEKELKEFYLMMLLIKFK